MVKAIFDELAKERPRNHFTIGIVDDVTHTSLVWNPALRTEAEDVDTALFTDSAPTARWERTRTRLKSSARKPTATSRATLFTTRNRGRSRSRTCVPAPARSARPTSSPALQVVACHQFEFVDKIDVLEHAAPGAVFLLNAPAAPHGVWERLPRELQQQMIEKRIRFFAIDAYAVAKEHGQPHQHDHANLLLCNLGRTAARGGDRQDQEGDREDLRQDGSGHGTPEL